MEQGTLEMKEELVDWPFKTLDLSAWARVNTKCRWRTSLLNHSGYYTYHFLEHIKSLHSAHRAYLCVPYGSHNKQRLFS
jgi:hypothetical protein